MAEPAAGSERLPDLVLPDEYDDPSARRRREWLAHYHASRRSSTKASIADAG